MTDLEQAIAFATEAHRGQTDKLGQPYIDHCIRVMDAVSEPAKRVAVLHDVVEDMTNWKQVATSVEYREAQRTGSPLDLFRAIPAFPAMAAAGVWDDLRGAGDIEEFTCDLEALLTLTRLPGLRYRKYIDECGRVPLAREVKVADLQDNLSRWVPELGDDLRKRYERALARLTTEGDVG